MGRAKLNMELIPKEKSRNSTFHKRKKGLKKKTFEFSTLCGVDTCMIIYGPKQPGQGDRPIESETYPNNLAEVHRIINRYRDIPRDERGVGGKRNGNLFDFFEDRKKKMDQELVKLRKKNEQSELDMWDEWTKDFKVEELKEFMGKLESGIEKMDARIELIKAGGTGGKQSVGGLIEYTPDTVNQNLFIQSLGNLPPVPPPQLSTTTTSNFHGGRDNDMVYQSSLCCVKSSSFDHRALQFNQYDHSLFNFDNGSSMPMITNNGYESLYGTGAFDNYSNPMVMPTPMPMPFKSNSMSFVHEPRYPTMEISYDDFGAESFRISPICVSSGYYTAQPNTSHLQHMLPGSSSASPQVMMHHNNHYQPSNELSDSMMNKHNKKSRFD